MCKPMYDLRKYFLRFNFLKPFLLFDVLQKVTPACILHHHEKVLFRLESLIQPDDVAVSYFPQNVDFLHYFLI